MRKYMRRVAQVMGGKIETIDGDTFVTFTLRGVEFRECWLDCEDVVEHCTGTGRRSGTVIREWYDDMATRRLAYACATFPRA